MRKDQVRNQISNTFKSSVDLEWSDGSHCYSLLMSFHGLSLRTRLENAKNPRKPVVGSYSSGIAVQGAIGVTIPTKGSWLMLPGASLARMTAQMGYDVSTLQISRPWLILCGQFVIVDCEHGNIADADMHASVAAIAAQGVSPIVRIPAPENWLVKRALDTGGMLSPFYSASVPADCFPF
jgi:hypothetical protein